MKFSDVDWQLPPPPPPERYIWTPVVRLGRKMAWGYDPDPNDKDILLPNVPQLEELERAKRLLKEYTYMEVADWLTKKTGRQIKAEGLRKRIKLEKDRQRDVTNLELYARKAKEASEKAEKIKRKIGGTKPTRVCPDFGDV